MQASTQTAQALAACAKNIKLFWFHAISLHPSYTVKMFVQTLCLHKLLARVGAALWRLTQHMLVYRLQQSSSNLCKKFAQIACTCRGRITFKFMVYRLYDTHCQNFKFELKKGLSKKNSYEHRAYESVDDGSLS